MQIPFLRRLKALDDRPVAGQLTPRRASAEDLIEQYRLLHQSKPDYGRSSERLLGAIQSHLEELGPISSILDYGCGRSKTVDWLAKLNDAKSFRYDPAIAEFQQLPVDKADVVINTDVLEHVPEEALDPLLARISSISQNAYFQIATNEAHTVLPNGENAHCTVRPKEWWRDILRKHFKYLRGASPNVADRVSFVTWPKASEDRDWHLASYREFTEDLSGRDCVVFGSAPNPSFGDIDLSGKKIICCNGAVLTLQQRFGRDPDYTFIHSHVPWRINNPADRDVREALAQVQNLGKLVILFHPIHTYNPKAYEHQVSAVHELNWEYRNEIFHRLLGSSAPFLDVSTGATAVASVAFAGAKSIRLVGFSFAQKGHSYNVKNLHRAHVSSDAALYTLLHASGYDIGATDESVRMILTGKLS